MTTVVEESVVISLNEACKLSNVNFLDVSARKSVREWYFSELLRLSMFLLLDVSAHSIDGVVGGYKRQVV